jgi:hypothetical protein
MTNHNWYGWSGWWSPPKFLFICWCLWYTPAFPVFRHYAIATDLGVLCPKVAELRVSCVCRFDVHHLFSHPSSLITRQRGFFRRQRNHLQPSPILVPLNALVGLAPYTLWPAQSTVRSTYSQRSGATCPAPQNEWPPTYPPDCPTNHETQTCAFALNPVPLASFFPNTEAWPNAIYCSWSA